MTSADSAKPLSILVVDDHQLVRTGMRRLLEDHPLVGTISEASSGEAAVDLASSQSFDVVMMDFCLPGMNGLMACERLLQGDPTLSIIMVAGKLEGPVTRRLIDCGVQGYITKGSSAEELDEAIRHVIDGRRYLSPDVARQVASHALNGQNGDPFERLTDRELEVVENLLEGLRNRQIAEQLHISEKTVSTHRSRAFEKLDITTTAELVRLAMRFGRWRDE